MPSHLVELVGAHQTAPCAACHVEGQSAPEAACESCHSLEGWASSAGSLVSLAPQVEHDLEGRADCLVCDDPAGQIQPAPSNHGDYASAQCGLCHKPVP